jgi:uncharacterized membrane protein
MDISFRTILLIGAVILTGLSSGFFYAWSVSVIPGTKKVLDLTYLETMQSVNKAILNPAFFAVFFGSILLLVAAGIFEYNINKIAFVLITASSISYLFGTIGVTGLGNVPLNDQLEVMNIAGTTPERIAEFRQFYETRWNRLHRIRTLFALLSFLLAVVALYIHSKNEQL